MDDVLTELRLLSENRESADAAVRRHIENQTRENKSLWDDIAALRDELHQAQVVLAKRIDSAMLQTPFTEVTDA